MLIYGIKMVRKMPIFLTAARRAPWRSPWPTRRALRCCPCARACFSVHGRVSLLGLLLLCTQSRPTAWLPLIRRARATLVFQLVVALFVINLAKSLIARRQWWPSWSTAANSQHPCSAPGNIKPWTAIVLLWRVCALLTPRRLFLCLGSPVAASANLASSRHVLPIYQIVVPCWVPWPSRLFLQTLSLAARPVSCSPACPRLARL
jgi:hypothetical protein